MNYVQSVKGMHDVLPDESCVREALETRVRQVLTSFGYRRLHFPIVEKTELFRRVIGDATDIVEKEMYSFDDIGQESLSLRPEGTAGCVRACLQNGLIGKGRQQRLWYSGPFFRRERPQRGRYRQFYQIGAEALGVAGPDIDAELLIMTALLWRRLDLGKTFVLRLNSLGDAVSRRRYRDVLVDYLEKHQHEIDETARRRIHSNPLRVLDSKDPATRAVVAEAPQAAEYLSPECARHFERLKTILKEAGIAFEEDPHLVRGLDYYTRTVFEWVCPAAGAQATVCAGGRYDNLVEQLGGSPTPAAGFALGVERLLMSCNKVQIPKPADVYIVPTYEKAEDFAHGFALRLREALPQYSVVVHCGGGSIKSQMRRADKSGARFALIIGEDELARQEVTLKPMRDESGQKRMSATEVAAWFVESL